jgi:hypothetical protein
MHILNMSKIIIRSIPIVIVLVSVLYGSVTAAEAASKSSGNEAVQKIHDGLVLKGMTKTDVVEAIGEPWQKDTTPVKARYTEKWIYSCESDKDLTYDCVYLYFMGVRVKNVGTMFNMPGEY